MVNCKSFQIIFEEPGALRHSATFDVAIPPECKGKFVDVKGEVHDMSQWERTLHSESTLTNIIYNARLNSTDDDGGLCGTDNYTQCQSITKIYPALSQILSCNGDVPQTAKQCRANAENAAKFYFGPSSVKIYKNISNTPDLMYMKDPGNNDQFLYDGNNFYIIK